MAGGIPRNIQQSETMLLGNGEASSSYVKQGNFFWTTCTWENYLPLTCMTCMILSMSKVWNISILKKYIHIINHPGGFHVSFIKQKQQNLDASLPYPSMGTLHGPRPLHPISGPPKRLCISWCVSSALSFATKSAPRMMAPVIPGDPICAKVELKMLESFLDSREDMYC